MRVFLKLTCSVSRQSHAKWGPRHKKCNASGSSPPLETNRVSTLLSFGGVVVSERVNSEDARIFEDWFLQTCAHRCPFLVGLLKK